MTRPLVWAHRGASGYCPENTLISFAKAKEMHADGVELDIQLTKDDQIVVCHDETIDRTSNGKGWLKDYTLEELRSFSWNKTHPEYEHAEIPTIAEVYELLKGTGMTINVELKTGIVFYKDLEEKIVKLTKDMGMEDQVIYSSFNHSSCVKIKQLNPDAYCGFLYGDGPIGAPEYAVKYGMNALHPALYNLQYPGFMQECNARGLDVNVYTVNEVNYMKMCAQLGVHAIFTNYPDTALKVFGNE